jgi:hypothetical protein
MNTWARANCAPRPRSGRGAQSKGEGVYLAWTRKNSLIVKWHKLVKVQMATLRGDIGFRYLKQFFLVFVVILLPLLVPILKFTLRSKVKVPQRSLWYVTHHLMVMHPHTKYHWPISKDKKVFSCPGHNIFFFRDRLLYRWPH